MSQCWPAQVALGGDGGHPGCVPDEDLKSSHSWCLGPQARKGQERALPGPDSWKSQAQPCSPAPGGALLWAGAAAAVK